MSHLSIIAISLIIFVAANTSCRPSTDSSEKTVPANLTVAASSLEEPHNDDLSHLEPKYLTNWSGTYPASLQPANSQSVSNVLKKIERIIPAGWRTDVDGNVITIWRNEEVNFYYRTAMRTVQGDIEGVGLASKDRDERLKRCNCKGKYAIKLLVTQLISNSAYAKLKKENAPCVKMFQDSKPMKMGLIDFVAENPDCIYKELPEFSGRDYSLFVTENIFRGYAVYPDDAADECSLVYVNLRTVFNAYEAEY